LASLSFNLDTIVKELLKVRTVKNSISSGLGVIDGKLVFGNGILARGGFGLRETERQPTEKGTQQSDCSLY